MATTTINHKRVTLSIEEKARLLAVIEVNEKGVLAVRSGSDPRIAYAVYHDEKGNVTSCACTGCKQYGRTKCAYRLAAHWYLEAARRALYTATFNIYE